jgi:probable HAF family extracellular repeat protein
MMAVVWVGRRTMAGLACLLMSGELAGAAGLVRLVSDDPERPATAARGMNADGTVVVGRISGFGRGTVAARWRSGAVPVPTLTAEKLASVNEAEYMGISGDGLIMCGWYAEPAVLPPTRGFRQTDNAQRARLPDLNGSTCVPPIIDPTFCIPIPPYFNTRALALSSDGSTVAGFSQTPAGQQAVSWSTISGATVLGDLPGGTTSSLATAVSGDGLVIAGYGEGENGQEAFRWVRGVGLVGLGDLPGGAFRSQALAVSDDGGVVVGIGSVEAGGEAFRWTQSEGMKGLGFLPAVPGRPPLSVAFAVSADGHYVVGGGSGAGGAFIWQPGWGMRPVADMLREQGVNISDFGWEAFLEATDISVVGDRMLILGNGQRAGTAAEPSHSEGFLAELSRRLVSPPRITLSKEATGLKLRCEPQFAGAVRIEASSDLREWRTLFSTNAPSNEAFEPKLSNEDTVAPTFLRAVRP